MPVLKHVAPSSRDHDTAVQGALIGQYFIVTSQKRGDYARGAPGGPRGCIPGRSRG